MPNRPARFTVADLRRATKAAEQAGPDWIVEIAPNGTISLVRRRPEPITAPPIEEEEERFVLW